LNYAADLGANFPNIKKHEPDALRWRLFGYADGFTSGEYDGGLGLGQLGASYALAPDTIIGGAFGFGGSTADMMAGGSAEFLGVSGSLFAAYVPRTGFQAIFSATGTSLDADIERGYMNGAGTATSEGETDGFGAGAALRVGYAFDVGTVSRLTPFGSLQAVHIELDGYTETTGPFPAVIGDIEDTVLIGKLGLEARREISAASWIWASAAWAHRDDDESAGIDAQLIGLFGLSGVTMTVNQDWAEATAGVSMGMDDGLSRLTASVTAYVPGEDISASGRVGFSRAF
jgi:outer membrane autotransporter protein